MTAIYLDHNATTPIDPRVRDEVMRCFEYDYGNASSPHEFGLRAKQVVHDARDRIARCCGARRHEVVFTSGATESNNIAILGLVEVAIKTGKRHIISSQIEHKAVIEPLMRLRRDGFDITLVAPNCDGVVNTDEVLRCVRPDTLLVSLMHVNNETGMIQPIGAVADGLPSRPDLYLHTDASQSFGKFPVDLDHQRIDMISVSSHKLNGPVGVGALIVRRRDGEGVPLQPLMWGGGQEMGIRPGTMPVALISGFGLAAELAHNERDIRRAICITLRGIVMNELAVLHPIYHGDLGGSLSHVVCVSIPGWDAEQLIEDLVDIASVSTGSACTSVCATASHVLSAMKVPMPTLDEAIRISWSHVTDSAELTHAMRKIVSLCAR